MEAAHDRRDGVCVQLILASAARPADVAYGDAFVDFVSRGSSILREGEDCWLVAAVGPRVREINSDALSPAAGQPRNDDRDAPEGSTGLPDSQDAFLCFL